MLWRMVAAEDVFGRRMWIVGSGGWRAPCAVVGGLRPSTVPMYRSVSGDYNRRSTWSEELGPTSTPLCLLGKVPRRTLGTPISRVVR